MKSRTYSNFRVEIDIPQPRWYEPKSEEDLLDRMRSEAKGVVDQATRHVDCPGPKPSFCWDTLYVCSHCNGKWTEKSDTYNGGCCDEDEKNNPNPDPAP